MTRSRSSLKAARPPPRGSSQGTLLAITISAAAPVVPVWQKQGNCWLLIATHSVDCRREDAGMALGDQTGLKILGYVLLCSVFLLFVFCVCVVRALPASEVLTRI